MGPSSAITAQNGESPNTWQLTIRRKLDGTAHHQVADEERELHDKFVIASRGALHATLRIFPTFPITETGRMLATVPYLDESL